MLHFAELNHEISKRKLKPKSPKDKCNDEEDNNKLPTGQKIDLLSIISTIQRSNPHLVLEDSKALFEEKCNIESSSVDVQSNNEVEVAGTILNFSNLKGSDELKIFGNRNDIMELLRIQSK